jgi:PAS domain S-box-containing protein
MGFAEEKSAGVPMDVFGQLVTDSPVAHVITMGRGSVYPIVWVNSSFQVITGYRASEVTGRCCRFLLGGDLGQKALGRFREAIQSRRRHTEVVRNYRKDGSLFHNELTLYSVQTATPGKSYIVWTLRDVTSSLESEERVTRLLAEKDARFSAYMENSNEALWRIDFDPPISLEDPPKEQVRAVFDRGKYGEANDMVAKIYAHKQGRDVRGKPLRDYMKESDPENVQWVTNLIRNQFTMDGLISRERGVSGGEIIALNNITPAISRRKVHHIWGASLDITELYSAQEKLQRTTFELAEKTKALEEKNIALKELIAQIGLEKKDLQDRVLANIEEVILPSIEKIRLMKGVEPYIETLRQQLADLTSGYGKKINELRLKLTPRELEVCNHVKGGLGNKEIARLLNISQHTVEKHRRMARKKLRLTNRSVNLYSYLNSI